MGQPQRSARVVALRLLWCYNFNHVQTTRKEASRGTILAQGSEVAVGMLEVDSRNIGRRIWGIQCSNRRRLRPSVLVHPPQGTNSRRTGNRSPLPPSLVRKSRPSRSSVTLSQRSSRSKRSDESLSSWTPAKRREHLLSARQEGNHVPRLRARTESSSAKASLRPSQASSRVSSHEGKAA